MSTKIFITLNYITLHKKKSCMVTDRSNSGQILFYSNPYIVYY